MQKSVKKIKHRVYESIRFAKDTQLSYEGLAKRFEYEPHCTDILPIGSKSILVGFSYDNVKIIINDILNYSEFDLISVSEDEKSVCYHFVKN